MSFLSFRHARRKAKKMVTIRPPRSPTPPSPGSFMSTDVVEIGDPSRHYTPLSLHMDIGFASEPLLRDSYSYLIHEPDPIGSPRQKQDRRSRRSTSRRGSVASPKSLHNGAGLYAVEDGTRTTATRRTPKVPPAPIKIPTNVHASRVQISRTADKSAELRPASMNLRDSPVVDDGASTVSGTTFREALIANMLTIQADQPHGCVSRRITRIDSAILPVGDNYLVRSSSRKYSKISNRDGDTLLPPIPPLAGVNGAATSQPTSEQSKTEGVSVDNVRRARKCISRDRLLMEVTAPEWDWIGSASQPSQFSPITELSTPEPSDTGTPDLIKDLSASVDGAEFDPQPNPSSSSDAASSAWKSPAASLSPSSGSGEGLIKVLEGFPVPPPNPGIPVGRSGSPSFLFRTGVPTNGVGQGQPQSGASPDVRRRAQSRSSSRRSPASVNPFILRPATLLPIGERRISPIRPLGGTTDGQEVATDDPGSLSTLPSSLPTRRSEDISQLPAFPESANRSSALRSSGFSNPLKSASRPPSHDFLDHVVLADESTIQRRKRTTSHGSLSTIPASGNRQTFPETPSVISPMFSPGVGHSRAHGLVPSSSPRRHASVPKSLLGRGKQASQRLVVRRSATTKSPMRMRKHKKSSRSRLRGSSACNSALSIPSSPLTVTPGYTLTTPDRAGLDDQPIRPQSLANAHPTDVACSRRSALQRRSEPQRKTIILPVPLALPPPPPSQPPSPQKTASLSRSSSLSSLPPPPPPPKLHLPPLPVSQPSAAPPADGPQARVSQHTLPPPPPPPPSPPPATPPSNPLVAPPTYLPHARVNSLSSTNNIDRPPRPLGPRPPYRNASSSPVPQDARLPSPSRDSFSRPAPMGPRACGPQAPSACSGSISGPKFQTLPPKFKGLTLEAAKWTFSSEELQALVSQAIRQSGQASSIRLLPQQVAFVEVPEELEKLNSLMHELRVQYRLQVRKRDVLLRAIDSYAESTEFSSIALRSKLQELHETSVNLDRIAEELYCLRDQAAQLSRMLAVHQGSALAMALRKLHSSFLKRRAEVQSLKDHIYALETERDEAWFQAQQVARDLDDLNDALQNQSHNPSPGVTRTPSHSSSRAVASSKSYLRVSRAGLHLSMNQLAPIATSQNGSRLTSCCPSTVCTPSTSDPVPPVPPIPHRPSLDIITSGLRLPSHNSARSVSDLSALSPSSARRALTRAEADLCGYLGIDSPELMPSHPRRSSIAAVSPSTMSPRARDMAFKRMSDIIDCRVTRGGGLSDRIQAILENEPDALLNTFNDLEP